MQTRVLVRARGLAAFRGALVRLATAGRPLDARRRVVILPTRASGELLRQAIEAAVSDGGGPAVILPDLVTREDWLVGLHRALPGGVRLLSRIEREVLLERAAEESGRSHPVEAPLFKLRPGLVSAMLDFYDELRRRHRGPRRFVRALFRELAVERGSDRGSESLIQQTRALAFAFLAYERAVAASGGLDEHVLHRLLIQHQPPLSFDHLVIAVADHPSDPRGLWPADFDLVGRLAHLARVDVVVTDEAHDAGFRERLEQELPGIEEARAPDVPQTPALVRPPLSEGPVPVFVRRDREEELRAVARAVRLEAAATGGTLEDSVAIVFQRPLPYLYLAQQVLFDAGVPYQAFDALPLAAEPYAALLDLALTVARTGGTREAVVALLGSSLVRFTADDGPIAAVDVAALDAVLAERRATGEAGSYLAEVEAWDRDGRTRATAARARRAARAAADVAGALEPFRTATSASGQVGALARFLRRHERTPAPSDAWRDRFLRARSAVLAALDEIAAACQRHHDAPRSPDALAAWIHHVLEAQTFTPRRGDAGVHLVDAVSARFGAFDHVHLVGLVETEWPERVRRSMFYTPGLLKTLGWPQEPDEMRAQQAAFRDLLLLAARTTRLSAFQLEGDAIVALSPVVETVGTGAAIEWTPPPPQALFAEEVLVGGAVPDGLDAGRAAWLAGRLQRPDLSTRAYSGFVDRQPARPYRVSRVDRYVDCPFKYFADTVLTLPEERDETTGLSPLERGTLLHALFERFYTDWQRQGRGAITPASLPDALALFSAITAEALGQLPAADRMLEETRLLGSIVGTGVAERVFELEADSGIAIRERFLETELRGAFTFPGLHGLAPRRIEIRGQADRVDLLSDGSIAVVDYKLGRMPDLKSSVQIAVYAHCARQKLEAADGAPHPVRAAMYLAFGDDRRLEGSLGGPSDPVGLAVEARVAEFAGAIDRIEAGEFPPRPRRPGECQWCGWAGVCRKEYRAEDDEAADAV